MTSRHDSTPGDKQANRNGVDDPDTRLNTPEWIRVLKKLDEKTQSQKHNAKSRT